MQNPQTMQAKLGALPQDRVRAKIRTYDVREEEIDLYDEKNMRPAMRALQGVLSPLQILAERVVRCIAWDHSSSPSIPELSTAVTEIREITNKALSGLIEEQELLRRESDHTVPPSAWLVMLVQTLKSGEQKTFFANISHGRDHGGIEWEEHWRHATPFDSYRRAGSLMARVNNDIDDGKFELLNDDIVDVVACTVEVHFSDTILRPKNATVNFVIARTLKDAEPVLKKPVYLKLMYDENDKWVEHWVEASLFDKIEDAVHTRDRWRFKSEGCGVSYHVMMVAVDKENEILGPPTKMLPLEGVPMEDDGRAISDANRVAVATKLPERLYVVRRLHEDKIDYYVSTIHPKGAHPTYNWSEHLDKATRFSDANDAHDVVMSWREKHPSSTALVLTVDVEYARKYKDHPLGGRPFDVDRVAAATCGEPVPPKKTSAEALQAMSVDGKGYMHSGFILQIQDTEQERIGYYSDDDLFADWKDAKIFAFDEAQYEMLRQIQDNSRRMYQILDIQVLSPEKSDMPPAKDK